MIRIEVRCKACRRLLDEPTDLPGEQRQPCPSCGSLGRERTVLMVPGEAAPAAATTEAAWLNLGSALARAASALEGSYAYDDLTDYQREHVAKARQAMQEALDQYREAQRKLREL